MRAQMCYNECGWNDMHGFVFILFLAMIYVVFMMCGLEILICILTLFYIID